MTEIRHPINTMVALIEYPGANADELIQQAVLFASRFGAKLVLLHISPPDPDFVGYDVGPQSVRRYAAKDLRDEHHAMQAMAADVRSQGVEATALCIQGDTVDRIVLEVDKLQADMVVATMHKHGLLHRLVHGDLAQSLLKKLNCPVLLIPD